MANTVKKDAPKWTRKPKSHSERKQFGNAKEDDVSVRGKRKPKNLPSDWDDKPVSTSGKKQNSTKKPKKETIRTAEEDAESVMKAMKKGGGKATFEGPKVKERKRWAPSTKVETPKKGGGYDRTKMKREKYDENTDIINFIECLIAKNYASANKYLNKAVESKLQQQIEKELSTPLFQ
jgi:hypothetical protein